MDHVRVLVAAGLAVLVRDLRIARRRPDLVVQAVAVPVVVLALAGIIFAADDAWPVALVDEAGGPAAAAVRQTVEETRGVTGPYFEVVETDADDAAHLVAAGRLHAVVRVPRDFARSGVVEVTTYNINTDAMKNVRLRLVQAANALDERGGTQRVGVDMRLDGPRVVTRGGYMGGTALVLALLLGSMLITANLVALEQEARTAREFILTPLGAATGTVGAMAAGVVLALPAAGATGLVAWLMGFRAEPGDLARAAAVVVPAMVASAGAGALLANLLRTHRAIQPVVILSALAGWFATGGFVPVAGLPPAARAVSTVSPPSYVYEWTASLVHGFDARMGAAAATALAAAAVGGVLLAVAAGRREQRRPAVQGQ